MVAALAGAILAAIDGRVDDVHGLRAAHHELSVFLAEFAARGRDKGREPADIDAEICLSLRAMRDVLLPAQRARNAEAAEVVGEIIDRIRRQLRRRADDAVYRAMPSPSRAWRGPRWAAWLDRGRPMRARVWAALTQIRRARQAWARGELVVCVLPDTLVPVEVKRWLIVNDAEQDAWFGEASAAVCR